MRDIEWDLVSISGTLVLLTMEEVEDGQPILMADFKDIYALSHKKTQSWLGMSRRGVRLGRGEPELKDGIWVIEEEIDFPDSAKNVVISSNDVSLKPIEG